MSKTRNSSTIIIALNCIKISKNKVALLSWANRPSLVKPRLCSWTTATPRPPCFTHRVRSGSSPSRLRHEASHPTQLKRKKSTTKRGAFLFGAEGGIRTLVWCYPQTDFESAPLWPLRYLCIIWCNSLHHIMQPGEEWLDEHKLDCQAQGAGIFAKGEITLQDATIYISNLLTFIGNC